MKNIRIALLTLLLAFLIININCRRAERIKIKLFIYENKEEILSPELFYLKNPELILKTNSLKKVTLIQRGTNDFTLELEFSPECLDKLKLLMSLNKGKRLVFMIDKRILFSPLILGPLAQRRVVIELPKMEKTEAFSIVKYFGKHFEFYDIRPYKGLDPELEKIYELRDAGETKEAIKRFFRLIEKAKDTNSRIFLFNEVALCHRLEGDLCRAGEIYKKIINETVDINLDNYKIISQAYFYLYRLEKSRKHVDLSEQYFNKGIEVLKSIINTFPLTDSAEEANLTIGGYSLLKGDIKEAEERAIIAKRGLFKCQGYLLMGLCYEYKKKFKEALEEYKSILRLASCKEEMVIANEFIKNLEAKKTNVEEFLATMLINM